MLILGVDPGTEQGAFVLFDSASQSIERHGELENLELRENIREWLRDNQGHHVAIEFLQCQGMPVGKETFETAYWIGATAYAVIRLGGIVDRVYRSEVKMHLCGTPRAKDPNIRQALIDRFGPVGTKKQPGKLYGISGHKWSALAVAVCAADRLTATNPKS